MSSERRGRGTSLSHRILACVVAQETRVPPFPTCPSAPPGSTGTPPGLYLPQVELLER